MTRIVAVHSVFPAYRYPQADLTQAVASLAGMGRAGMELGGTESGGAGLSGAGLGGAEPGGAGGLPRPPGTPAPGRTRRALLERLHANAGVDTRHTVFPLAEYGMLGSGGGAGKPGVAGEANGTSGAGRAGEPNGAGRAGEPNGAGRAGESNGADGTSGAGESSGTVNDRYIEEATALGERALRGALAASGLAAADLDLLIVTSVTGVAVPSLDARLIPRLGLRPDVKRLPVFGLGCVAGAAGLARLHDYLLGWPNHRAALLAVELCSLTFPSVAASRAAVTTADLVASALFGDGAAAVIATGERARRIRGDRGRVALLPRPSRAARVPRMPRVVATRSEVYPDSADALGWRLGPDGFRIVLTAELAEVVEERLSGSVTGFLAGHGLTVDDIGTWICHPGGPKVLDAAQRALKLPAGALATSRRSLAEAGNMSSVSVLHILELTIAERPPAPGSFGLMIGLGPGVSAELVLLRW